MDFDIGTVLSILNLALANPLVLGAVIGLFLGWNLPQPAFAKFLQDKVVTFLTTLWSKFKKDDSA